MKKEYIIIAILIVIIGLSFIDLKGKKISSYEYDNTTYTLYLDKSDGILTRIVEQDGEEYSRQEYYLRVVYNEDELIIYDFGDFEIEYDKITKEYSIG